MVVKKQEELGPNGEQPESPQQLLERYQQLVADASGARVPLEGCTAKVRLGGRFVSLCIPAMGVPSSTAVQAVFAALKGNPRVVMAY